MAEVEEVAHLSLPTTEGEFDARAYRCPSGYVYLALVKGLIGDGRSVLSRLHSECLTGDALGSLRCDCGVQLKASLRMIAAEGRGVLVYATGHEGRGIGLVNKLRAYMEQEAGADTVDANLRLGLPIDDRRYAESAAVLLALGVRSTRLLTNNPRKATGLQGAGIEVESIDPLPIASHLRNAQYLSTKQQRLGHLRPQGNGLSALSPAPADVRPLLGDVHLPQTRPYVILKYAQSLDGRIATTTGDSRWISGEDERRISHALRAACDAVLVGVGTILNDNPQLTVRLVAGASPLRVVLDSMLRTPLEARVLGAGAPTLILTSDRADPTRRLAFAERSVGVRSVPEAGGKLELPSVLAELRSRGVQSLLVEGGARVITSMLEHRLVDRLIVSVAPKIIGAGREAVGDLRVDRVVEGLSLGGRSLHVAGDDVLLAWDVTGDLRGTGSRGPEEET
ncbi:MAG: GTP cyclohydrolase II RibA [Actinomycetota bacterium]